MTDTQIKIVLFIGLVLSAALYALLPHLKQRISLWYAQRRERRRWMKHIEREIFGDGE